MAYTLKVEFKLINLLTHIYFSFFSWSNRKIWKFVFRLEINKLKIKVWPGRDLNTQPSDLESDALPLRHRASISIKLVMDSWYHGWIEKISTSILFDFEHELMTINQWCMNAKWLNFVLLLYSIETSDPNLIEPISASLNEDTFFYLLFVSTCFSLFIFFFCCSCSNPHCSMKGRDSVCRPSSVLIVHSTCRTS